MPYFNFESILIIMGTERRQYPRVDIDFVTVEVYSSLLITEPPKVAEICSMINLSENGMMFKADNAFEQGALLRLTFILHESPIIIRTDATVVHVNSDRRHEREIGVQFKNIGLTEQRLIRHFVEKNLTENQSN